MIIDLTTAYIGLFGRFVCIGYMISICFRAILFGEVWHEKYY